MKTVIIVSKCLRVTKFNPLENWYEFHFKGVCAGESLKKVMLLGRVDSDVKAGEEYLIYVQLYSFTAGTLKGRIIKLKKLDECWDLS